MDFDELERAASSIRFKDGVVQEVMKLHFSDPKTRFSSDGNNATNQVMICFLEETIWRTMNQARSEGLNTTNLDHVEKILPQLVTVLHGYIVPG